MSSSRRSDDRPGGSLDGLARDLPTTAADVVALSRARARERSPHEALRQLHRLAPPAWVPRRRRPTSAGFEPFELG